MRAFIWAMATLLSLIEIGALVLGFFPRWPGPSVYLAQEPGHFWTLWAEMGIMAIISWVCVFLARRPREPKPPYEK